MQDVLLEVMEESLKATLFYTDEYRKIIMKYKNTNNETRKDELFREFLDVQEKEFQRYQSLFKNTMKNYKE